MNKTIEETSVKNDQYIQIGTNLRRARESRGVRAQELILKLNLLGIEINSYSLSKIEANRQHIKASQLKGVLKVLDCSIDELLYSENDFME